MKHSPALGFSILCLVSLPVRTQLVTCAGSDAITLDCNGNNPDDYCDINEFGASVDVDGNGVPDECDIAEGTSADANGNGFS